MSQQNGQRILQPGAVNIDVQLHAEMPNATPAVAPIAGPNGQVKVVIFGGLTKLEHLAGQVAASLALAGDDNQQIAERAVAVARAVLTAAAEQHPE